MSELERIISPSGSESEDEGKRLVWVDLFDVGIPYIAQIIDTFTI